MDGRTWVGAVRKGDTKKRLSFRDGKPQYPRGGGGLEHGSHHFLKGPKLRSLLLRPNPDLGLLWDVEFSTPAKPLPCGREQPNTRTGLHVTVACIRWIRHLHSSP